MEDKMWLVKIIVCVAVLGLAIWAFARHEYVIGGIVLVVFGAFIWLLFLRNMTNREPLELHVMIAMSLSYLEDQFKLTPGKSRDFKLWHHEPSGKTDYKLVFFYEDSTTAKETYYPVTIDRFTGKFGEATGTSLSSVSLAEYFFKKMPGQPISRPVEIEDIQELFKKQQESLGSPAPVSPQAGADVQ
jgi:hypothetical protein